MTSTESPLKNQAPLAEFPQTLIIRGCLSASDIEMALMAVRRRGIVTYADHAHGFVGKFLVRHNLKSITVRKLP